MNTSPNLWPEHLDNASTLAVPLHRGYEVARFGELSRRQEGLTVQESDELYRYRLRRLALRERRLERAAAGEDEGELRGAIADYSCRLRELRRFELSRQQAGLATGYPGDPEIEQSAREQLVELAAPRPRGLIAGDGESVQAGAATVTWRMLPSRQAPRTRRCSSCRPASVQSDALARNVEAMAAEGAALHLVRDASDVRRDRPALVLNRGGSAQAPTCFPRRRALRLS